MDKRKEPAFRKKIDDELIRESKNVLSIIDRTKTLHVHPTKKSTKPISLRIPVETLQQLWDVSLVKNIGYQLLIKQYINDGLRKEAFSSDHTQSETPPVFVVLDMGTTGSAWQQFGPLAHEESVGVPDDRLVSKQESSHGG